MSSERKISGVFHGGEFHWVGDGFRVANYFPSGNDIGQKLSPFLLMDYHPFHNYPPTKQLRGVGPHPHRGFETVTIAWQGTIAHHDSDGNAGVIGPGDVQWMTAASGILHKEYHEQAFAERGGPMHMMQLWVNLPRAHKMEPPRYQPILASEMATVELEEGAGVVRLIAGQFRGVRGPARTFSPINLWEIVLHPKGRLELSFPPRENAALLVLDGNVTINGHVEATENQLVLFANEGQDIQLRASSGARVLLLNGEPIDEPVVQYGPFVMNTTEEIRQAITDYKGGKFGKLD
jgi:redox-sensitive bicupin YhaK (pirin superfamily)